MQSTAELETRVEQVEVQEASVINGVLVSQAGERVPHLYGARVRHRNIGVQGSDNPEDWVAEEVPLPDGYSRVEGGLELRESDGTVWYFPAVRYENPDGEDKTFIFFGRKEVAEICTERERRYFVDLTPVNRGINGLPAYCASIRDRDSERIKPYLIQQLRYSAAVDAWKFEQERSGHKNVELAPPEVPDFNEFSEVKTSGPASELASKYFPTANGACYVKPSL